MAQSKAEPKNSRCPMFCRVPRVAPAPPTITSTPVTIKRSPSVRVLENRSCRTAAARRATMTGITPGKRAPAWAAGANSNPALRESLAQQNGQQEQSGHPEAESRDVPRAQTRRDAQARDDDPCGPNTDGGQSIQGASNICASTERGPP